MNKYILGIDGMGCGSCEAHVNDTIRRNFKIVKVSSSHINKQTVVIAQGEYKADDFKRVLDPTGYRMTSFKKEVAVKKLFSWR